MYVYENHPKTREKRKRSEKVVNATLASLARIECKASFC